MSFDPSKPTINVHEFFEGKEFSVALLGHRWTCQTAIENSEEFGDYVCLKRRGHKDIELIGERASAILDGAKRSITEI